MGDGDDRDRSDDRAQVCDELNVDPDRVAEATEHLVAEDVAQALAETFGLLGDPNRVRLIAALARMELCVGELAATLRMSMSAVSHQLRLLRRLRVVKSRRQGRHIYYSLDDDHIATIYRCGLDHVGHGDLRTEDDRPGVPVPAQCKRNDRDGR